MVTVHETGAGVPAVADGSVWLSGSTFTPWADAVIENGLTRVGVVRRASTSSSQTPGSGFAYAREVLLQDGALKFV